MFVVIYQFFLKPGTEEIYNEAWKRVVSYFIDQRGALGSSLHKGAENLWVAYSRWPSKELRDNSWQNPDACSEEIRKAILLMKDSVDSELPEIHLDLIEDYLSLQID